MVPQAGAGARVGDQQRLVNGTEPPGEHRGELCCSTAQQGDQSQQDHVSEETRERSLTALTTKTRYGSK